MSDLLPVWILGGGAVLVLAFVAGSYNGLVKLTNYCDESWSDIDTELKRRYDLIPNLVETVKGYAKHEREVLEEVTRARNAAQASHGSPNEQAKTENQMIAGVRKLFAVSERYPDLKANTSFLALQQELANTEDRIQRARRFYNANVRDLKNRIESFPSSLIASLFGFKPKEFFEIDEAVRATPQVQV